MIGILGGSFDPPHAGHIYISQQAIKRLALHQVWWLVAKQNPLKRSYNTSFTQRIDLARAITKKHPKIRVVTYENMLRSNYTYDIVKRIMQRFYTMKFFWLMGADNLCNFHKWHYWKDLVRLLSIIIFTRDHNRSLLSTPLRSNFPQDSLHNKNYWQFIHIRSYVLSSSLIRQDVSYYY